MQVRTSGWILVASGVAITALIACSEGQWAKDPLPTCDEGDEGCGSGGNKSSTNKGGSKSKAPGVPTPADETQSTSDEENNDDDDDPLPPSSNTKPDASTTPPKDAGGTSPTKGPNCLSNQNTCIAVTLKCGCPEDCCAGTVCAQVGGLVQNTCCKITAAPCTSHSECCGQLLCKPNASGTGSSCQ